MKKFLIAYEFNDGSQGWLTVHAADQLDAMGYFYTPDVDGRAIFVVEVMDIPTVEGCYNSSIDQSMKKFLIAYEFDGGSQGWMTVHAEDQRDAFYHFYISDINGKAIFVVEVMDIPTVEV